MDRENKKFIDKLWVRKFRAVEIVAMMLSEMFGTTILVWIGCMSCAEDVYPFPQTVIIPAFAFGFAASISVMLFISISGCHINPAVTVGAVVLGKAPFDVLFFYIPMQYIGGMLGYGMVFLLVPEYKPIKETFFSNKVCLLHVPKQISPFNVFLFEMFGTWILMWVVCSLMDSRNEKITSTSSLRIGVGIAALVLGIAYQGGPYAGGILGALTFRFLFELNEKYSLIRGGRDEESV